MSTTDELMRLHDAAIVAALQAGAVRSMPRNIREDATRCQEATRLALRTAIAAALSDAHAQGMDEALAICREENAEAASTIAYAEGRADERAEWMPLLQAIQPLIEFNSPDEFITIRVRTADIAKARAAAAYVKGH